MGFADDFALLWKQGKKQMDSAVLLQEKKENISCAELQQEYDLFVKKWTDSSSAEHEFLKRMRRMEPELAGRLETGLTGFSFSEVPEPAAPPFILYAAAEAAVCLLGALFGYILAGKSFLGKIMNEKIVMLLAAVILGSLAAGVIRDIYRNKKEQARHRAGEEYRAQIEKLGGELEALCRDKQ